MPFATHLGPIRFGTVKEGSSINCGLPVLTQSATLAYTDTTAKNLFIIPAGAQILSVVLDVITAFNDTTTNVIDVGNTADGAFYVNDAEAGTAVHVVATLVAANLATITNIGTSDVQVTATYAGTGTGSSAGSARVTMTYIMRNSDGTVTPAP